MPDPLLALGLAALAAAVLSVLFWPQRGLAARWRRAHQMTQRVLIEDALKHVHTCEMQGRRASVESLAGVLQIPRDNAAGLLARMQDLGLALAEGGNVRLTGAGREASLHIIRAHRLWERYLADQTGFAEAEWHTQADRLEHKLMPAEVDALAAQLGNPTFDPHGDPIPDAGGDFVAQDSLPLPALPLDRPGRIVHVEDEPEAMYAQLVAEGLFPGMVVRVTELSDKRVRFWANGDQHVLAPLLAANVAVMPLAQEARPEAISGDPLSTLAPGQQGRVVTISPRVRGPERRRLMDLGLLPGTVVTAEFVSPGGDPTAYRIRDALIALRAEQASLITVDRMAEAL